MHILALREQDLKQDTTMEAMDVFKLLPNSSLPNKREPGVGGD